MFSGHIDECGLESARRELLAADAVESLRVSRATAASGAHAESGASVLSAELVAMDAQLTGLRRERYLRALAEKAGTGAARGECELLECRFGDALVGYSLMLELRRVYWIALVRYANA